MKYRVWLIKPCSTGWTGEHANLFYMYVYLSNLNSNLFYFWGIKPCSTGQTGEHASPLCHSHRS